MTRLDFLFRSTLFFLVTSFTQAKATRCTNCEDPGGDPGGDDGGDGTTRQNSPSFFSLVFSLLINPSHLPTLLLSSSFPYCFEQKKKPPLQSEARRPNSQPASQLPNNSTHSALAAGKHAHTSGTAPHPFATEAATRPPSAPSRWRDPTIRASVRGTPRPREWMGISARAVGAGLALWGLRCCVSRIVSARLFRLEFIMAWDHVLSGR